jgi:enoyl-CoA hydratase/carnithine racemase
MTTHVSHTDTISQAVVDGVLTVTLPISDDGLLSLAVCDQLTELLIAPPDSARVLVLRTAGASFCVGRERTAASIDELPLEVDRLVAVNHALRNSSLMSIAVVHGAAAGFGVGLAALCDFAVAVPEATFSFPEIEIGLAPVLVLAWLPQLVGRREALRLAATGAAVDAQRALQLGIVTHVVTREDLDDEVTVLAGVLAQRNPRVLSEIREFLRVTDQAAEIDATEMARARLVVGSLRRGRD